MSRTRALAAVVTLFAAMAAASPFGTNAHVPNDAVADRVVEAGITWVRIDFLWSTVEPERDVYDWRVYDALVDRLETRGLRAYATLQGTPAWATSGSEFSGVPDDVAQWQEFVYLAASRYRGRIAAWGIWNEPNSRRFWEGSRSDYVNKLLIPGSRAVRAADPRALVAGPDLAHLTSADWDGWLREVIATGGSHLDVVTHHYYPSWGKAGELVYEFDDKPDLPWGSPSVRRLLKDIGWWGRPFWLTETGVQSGVEGPGDQADYYQDVLDDWFGAKPEGRWIERIFFYQMHDPLPPASTTWGILQPKPDLMTKPAFFAYKAAIAGKAVDDARILDLQSPAFVRPGQRAKILVILYNSGTTTWRGSAGYHVDVRLDPEGWRLETDVLQGDFQVAPGHSMQFVLLVEAPWDIDVGVPSAVSLEARLVADDGRRFGDPIHATITATETAPPTILAQPRNVLQPAGRQVTLSVDVESGTPLRYQWRRNSVELTDDHRLAGSKLPRLELRNLDASLEGDYACVVTNDAGSVVTSSASVKIGISRPRRPTGRMAPPATGPTGGFDVFR